MPEPEQARPLAPGSHRINIDNGDDPSTPPVDVIIKKKQRRRRCIKWCGCVSAVLLILILVIIILAFTVFRVKDPTLRLNSVTIDGWSQVVWTNLQPGMNLTVIADISVKNPNVASFKYNNATTSLFYGGRTIGEAMSPPGNAKARRTVSMNITIYAMLDRIIGLGRLGGDIISGNLPVSSYTDVRGKVNILGIKKGVGVKMNCTMTLNIASQGIQDLNCKRKVSL